MSAGYQRDEVVSSLRADEVAHHLGIVGQWRGRWMRSARCGETDHGSECFALSRDGRWHCHSCDKGGDLLHLLALGEGLDIRDEFPRVLEIAAGIAGVELVQGASLFDDAPTRPRPKDRPPPVELAPIGVRISNAKRRAAWVWDRLFPSEWAGIPQGYLRDRGLDPDAVLRREELRCTPLRLGPELRQKIEQRDPGVSDDTRTLWWTMGTRRGTLSVAVPVRCVDDGALIDVRLRRVAPLDGQPKIIGMIGNVTVAPAERGKMRRLIGCYGRPHAVDSDHVVIVEGAMDYLTALQVWPNAQVLGAVEAGTLNLVTMHAAAALAARDSESRLTIVEQCDPPRQLKDGRVVPGAADMSVNEGPNAATKVAVALLGPRRVGWVFCELANELVDGKPVKDLNDLVRAGADISGMHRWWTDPESPE